MDFLRMANLVLDRVTGGNTSSEGSTGQTVELTNIKQDLNDIAAEMVARHTFDWRHRTANLSLREPYTTGTVSVNQGSRGVTGSGTAWSAEDKWQIFQVAGDDTWYTVEKVVSATSIILAARYQGATAAGSSYTITRSRALMPADCVAVRSIRNPGSPVKLEPFDDWMVDSVAPDILGKTGTVRGYILLGRTEEAYYDAGTVEISGATVTGTGTTWTTDMEGRELSVIGDKSSVRIQSVDTTTQITLQRSYPGTTTAGSSYQIDPPPRLIVQVFPAPTARVSFPVRYLRGHTYMVADTDLPIIPGAYEYGLLAGATARALARDGQEDKAISAFAQTYSGCLELMVRAAQESEEKDFVMRDGMRDMVTYPDVVWDYLQSSTITIGS